MLSQYILHDIIGKGGYSTIYKCTDHIGIRYACKMLPKHKNKRERVSQEIHLMKTMKSSSKVVRFIDALEDDDNYYIIQEWCRGGSVEEYIKSYSQYGVNTVASIVRGVSRSLYHLHENNIIHRDIKSGNVLLGDKSDDADVKLGDLGISIMSKLELVEVDNLVATPWFMAPENLSSKYHKKSDIWSLGVLTYQLLSGKLPFNDKKNITNPSIALIWRSILNDEPNFSSKRWETIDADAIDFIRLCLNKDYEKRPTPTECLNHPFLTKTDCNDRFKGQQLNYKPFEYTKNIDMNAVTLDMYYKL
jgi:calcium-dependent protein kinase